MARKLAHYSYYGNWDSVVIPVEQQLVVKKEKLEGKERPKK